MSISAQHQDHSDEARRATLEQFATLPADTQTAFLQKTFEHPELRTNPELLQAAMQDTIATHFAGQHKLELEAMLQLSPQLTPTGREHEMAQQAALEQLAASTTTVQANVKREIDSGKTVEQVKAQVVSNDNVTQALVAKTAQEHSEEKQRDQVAQNDEVHREKVGLTQPEQAKEAHPFAAMLANTGAAEALQAALGGHRQNVHAEGSGPTGGKTASQDNQIRLG